MMIIIKVVQYYFIMETKYNVNVCQSYYLNHLINGIFVIHHRGMAVR